MPLLMLNSIPSVYKVQSFVKFRCNYLTLNGSDHFALWRMCREIQKKLLHWHAGCCKFQLQKLVHPLKPLFHLHKAGSLHHVSPGCESVWIRIHTGSATKWHNNCVQGCIKWLPICHHIFLFTCKYYYSELYSEKWLLSLYLKAEIYTLSFCW